MGITEKDWVDFWAGLFRILQDEGEPAALHTARALQGDRQEKISIYENLYVLNF